MLPMCLNEFSEDVILDSKRIETLEERPTGRSNQWLTGFHDELCLGSDTTLFAARNVSFLWSRTAFYVDKSLVSKEDNWRAHRRS